MVGVGGVFPEGHHGGVVKDEPLPLQGPDEHALDLPLAGLGVLAQEVQGQILGPGEAGRRPPVALQPFFVPGLEEEEEGPGGGELEAQAPEEVQGAPVHPGEVGDLPPRDVLQGHAPHPPKEVGEALQEAPPGVVGLPVSGEGREEACLNGVAEEGGCSFPGDEVGEAAGEVEVGEAQDLEGQGVAPAKAIKKPAVQAFFL